MTYHLSHILTRKAWLFPGLLVLGFFFVIGPVEAQSNRDLSNRINRLENEIDTLSRALFRGEEPPPGTFSGNDAGDAAAQANLEIRLQQMEQELRGIRGQIEEQGFAVRQLKTDMERFMGDVELRLNDLEGRGASNAQPQRQGALNYTTQSPAVTTQPVSPRNAGQQYTWDSHNGSATPSQPTSQPSGAQSLGSYSQSPVSGNVSANADSAASAYENAFALLKNNQYDAAEKEFQGFLDQYPGHVLTGNAKYWLGETFYVRGDFDRAARLFAEGYQQYPEGSKAADNLLKLGMSLSALGKSDDACVALAQIEKAGFSGAGPVIRRADQEKTRIGCS